MSTHRCPVVPVVMERHPNADSLSIVRVAEFTYCARTEDWLNNPLGVWVEPDMMIPADRPEFAFLEKSHKVIENNGIKGYRIKVKRLRGVMSMGLMIPAPEGAKVGDDYREHFGIVRYEPPEPLSTGGEACKPPPGVRYVYDVESAYNFVHLFTDGEEVVATEKVHGCLQYHTRITMSDGTKRDIGKLVNENSTNEFVLGYQDGKVIPTKILNVYKNGNTTNWLKVIGGIDGNSYFAVYATPNHKFYVIGNYVEAKNLKAGDIVTALRSNLGLNPVQLKITSVEEIIDSGSKFDIETETHNFFANDILVHNSNSRFCYMPDLGMFCGSRTEWKRQNADNLWWKALAHHPEVEEFCKNHPEITVYGEAYGQVKNFPYNLPKGKVGIIVFDLLRNGAWVDHDEARELGKNLPWVPILYRGPWNKELIFNLAEGKSEIAKIVGVDHIREGLVIKPIKERGNLEIGRTQLKIVSNAYLEKE